jgi:N-ethylmaleimide reductase
VAVKSKGYVSMRHPDGRRERVEASMPRALETHELPRVVADYAHAARCAKAAGFDGVEVHAANSYLINQFLSGSLNTRDDAWGGVGFDAIENRMRLLLEVVDANAAVFGPARVGVRLSPMGSATDLPAAPDDEECMRRVAEELGTRRLSYLHLFNHYWPKDRWNGPFTERLCREMKERFAGPIVLNGYGSDVAAAQGDLDAGLGDCVAFGKLAISNPDLPERFASGAALAPWDDTTFYGDDARGYNDYPRASRA